MSEQNYATDGVDMEATQIEMKLHHDNFDHEAEGHIIPIVVECDPGQSVEDGRFGGFPFSVFDSFKSETLVAYLKERWRIGEGIAMRIVNEIHRQAIEAKDRDDKKAS